MAVSVWLPVSPRTGRAKEEIYANVCIIYADYCVLGHAPGVPGLGEGAGPRTASLCAGASVKEKEESGISVLFGACTADQPPAPQRLPALHAVTRQHELTEQHGKPVAQTHAQIRPGKTCSLTLCDCYACRVRIRFVAAQQMLSQIRGDREFGMILTVFLLPVAAFHVGGPRIRARQI